MFVTVNQCKKVIMNYLDYTGRGGFRTGTVESTSPLRIKLNDKLVLDEDDFYTTDNCIGLKTNGKILRPALKAGDGVLLIYRPGNLNGVKYILLDRIQSYTAERSITVN